MTKTFLILGHGSVPPTNYTVFQGRSPITYLKKEQPLPVGWYQSRKRRYYYTKEANGSTRRQRKRPQVEDITFNDPFYSTNIDDQWKQIKKHFFIVPENVTFFYATPPHHKCFATIHQAEEKFMVALANKGIEKTLLFPPPETSEYIQVYDSMTQISPGSAAPNLILQFNGGKDRVKNKTRGGSGRWNENVYFPLDILELVPSPSWFHLFNPAFVWESVASDNDTPLGAIVVLPNSTLKSIVDVLSDLNSTEKINIIVVCCYPYPLKRSEETEYKGGKSDWSDHALSVIEDYGMKIRVAGLEKIKEERKKYGTYQTADEYARHARESISEPLSSLRNIYPKMGSQLKPVFGHKGKGVNFGVCHGDSPFGALRSGGIRRCSFECKDSKCTDITYFDPIPEDDTNKENEYQQQCKNKDNGQFDGEFWPPEKANVLETTDFPFLPSQWKINTTVIDQKLVKLRSSDSDPDTRAIAPPPEAVIHWCVRECDCVPQKSIHKQISGIQMLHNTEKRIAAEKDLRIPNLPKAVKTSIEPIATTPLSWINRAWNWLFGSELPVSPTEEDDTFQDIARSAGLPDEVMIPRIMNILNVNSVDEVTSMANAIDEITQGVSQMKISEQKEDRMGTPSPTRKRKPEAHFSGESRKRTRKRTRKRKPEPEPDPPFSFFAPTRIEPEPGSRPSKRQKLPSFSSFAPKESSFFSSSAPSGDYEALQRSMQIHNQKMKDMYAHPFEPTKHY